MRDQIDLRGSQGPVINPTGPVNQHFGDRINTGGGAYIGGSVNTGGGAFVGRDQHITSSPPSPELAQFLALLDELRAALPASGLDAGTRQIAEGDLQGWKVGEAPAQ
jgi:hypothetical protein